MRSGHGKAVDWWSLGALMYDMLTGAVSAPSHSLTPVFREFCFCRQPTRADDINKSIREVHKWSSFLCFFRRDKHAIKSHTWPDCSFFPFQPPFTADNRKKTMDKVSHAIITITSSQTQTRQQRIMRVFPSKQPNLLTSSMFIYRFLKRSWTCLHTWRTKREACWRSCWRKTCTNVSGRALTASDKSKCNSIPFLSLTWIPCFHWFFT